MNRRRRNILIACAAIVVVIALVAWFGRSGGQPKVKLLFLGYTNRVVNLFITSSALPPVTNWQPAALFIATNTHPGRVKLEQLHLFNQRLSNNTRAAYPADWTDPIINGRDSLPVFTDVPRAGESFRARVTYIDYGLRERLSDRWRASTNKLVRLLAARLRTPRTPRVALSEWLVAPALSPPRPAGTNPPPGGPPPPPAGVAPRGPM